MATVILENLCKGRELENKTIEKIQKLLYFKREEHPKKRKLATSGIVLCVACWSMIYNYVYQWQNIQLYRACRIYRVLTRRQVESGTVQEVADTRISRDSQSLYCQAKTAVLSLRDTCCSKNAYVMLQAYQNFRRYNKDNNKNSDSSNKNLPSYLKDIRCFNKLFKKSKKIINPLDIII